MVILSFVVFSIIVGIITFMKTKENNLETSEGYFLGGRSLNGKVIAGSLLLTNLSAVSFIGMSAQAYSDNMSVMGWEVVSGLTLVIVGLVLLPKYLKQGITTIPEFIESRFDKQTCMFVTILFLISYIVNQLPIVLYSGAVAMGQMFDIESMFNISYNQSIWLMVWVIGIIGSIYAIFGGLKAVAVSDTINGIILIVGGLLVPFFAVLYLGDGSLIDGFKVFLTSTPAKFNSIGKSTDPLPFSTLFTGLILVNLYFWGTDQSIIQRALGAENLKEGQKGLFYAGFLKIVAPVIVIIPGILAFQIFKGSISNADIIYPRLVNVVLPKPLVGIFATSMMGATLSTFNSVLNSASTLFALNIYKPLFGKNKSDLEIIKIGKIFGTVIAILSMFGAPFIMNAPKGLFEYVQTINGFFNVPIFTIIFMGYFAKRVPAIAAKISITFFVVTYGITQLFWNTGLHFLHISAILFIISCIIMLVIGKMYPNKEEFIIKENKSIDLVPWANRFKVGGLVVFVMLAAYVVFSPIGLASENGIGAPFYISLIAMGAVCYFISKICEKKFS
ncbi:solute:sodium symporter family transporter [Fusobacterium sp.]|uniref:solute:sodium symporter family transporter n=1 Tax=Fusobacterium sp. TaxID=68766 RepID=UPI00260E5E41|nr:solute:sodium symporter family transporter [Fusobacterium sp.]